MSRERSETPTPTIEHWPSRRPSFSRPPIRSPESPRLTEEEADELTSPYLPYETVYTYAYSRAYNKSLPDHWEVPNMVPRSESPYMHVSDSAPSLLRQSWYYIQDFFVQIWNYLYWIVKTTTLDGPVSILNYLYDFLLYILVSAKDGAIYLKDSVNYYTTKMFVGRRHRIGKDSYPTKIKNAFYQGSSMIWTILSFIGSTLLLPVNFLVYSVTNSKDWIENGVARPAASLGKSAYNGISTVLTTILNVVLWPFDFVGRLVLDKWSQLTRKHVRINERSRRVRRFSMNDSPSVVRDSEDDDDDDPEILEMHTSAQRGRLRKTPGRREKELYDLRTRLVMGDTTDEDADSPNPTRPAPSFFKSATAVRETPVRRIVHQNLQRASATTPRRGRPAKNVYVDTDDDDNGVYEEVTYEPSRFSPGTILSTLWNSILVLPYLVKDLVMIPAPIIHGALSKVADFGRYLYNRTSSWINNTDDEPIALRVREPRTRRVVASAAPLTSTGRRTSKRIQNYQNYNENDEDVAAHYYDHPSASSDRPLLSRLISGTASRIFDFGSTVMRKGYNILYFIALAFLSCIFAVIDLAKWVKNGIVSGSSIAYSSIFGTTPGRKKPIRLEVANDFFDSSKDALINSLGMIWKSIIFVPMAIVGRDTDGNKRERSWWWLLVPLLLLLFLFLVARHDPKEELQKKDPNVLDLASKQAYNVWGYMDQDRKYARSLNGYYKSYVVPYTPAWKTWQLSDTPVYKIGHTTYNLGIATGKLAFAPLYYVYDKSMDALAYSGVRKIRWPSYEDLPEMPKMATITEPLAQKMQLLPTWTSIRDRTRYAYNVTTSTTSELLTSLFNYLFYFTRNILDVLTGAMTSILYVLRDILYTVLAIIRNTLFAIVDFFKELANRPAPIYIEEPNVLRKTDELNTRTVYVPQQIDEEKIIAEVTRRVLAELKSHPLPREKVDDAKIVQEISTKVLAAIKPPSVDESKLIKEITAKVLIGMDTKANHGSGFDEERLVDLVSEKVLVALQPQLDSHKPIDRNSMSQEIVNLVLSSLPKQTSPPSIDEKKLTANIMAQIQSSLPKSKDIDEAQLAKSVAATVMASLKLPKEVDEKKLAEKVAAQVLGSIKQPATIDQAKLVQDVTQKVIASLDSKFTSYEEEFRRSLEERIQKTVTTNVNVDMSDSKLETLIKALIAQALDIYDADKTGLFDYALESAGASVISTRCSENYNSYSRLEKFWNIPLYYSTYGPRVVIQRGSQTLNPGECWCFKHGKGYLTIDLSHPINISHISYEHIRKEMSPEGYLNSAPKTFKLWAYKQENDLETRFLLGEFEYSLDGRPLQFFYITKQPPYPVKIIEMEVISNYGADFTCLYRLRVHGKKYSVK
ncbi:hypothetical protein WR25_17908 [Diploscapter pachys]|uniref:SUN domain-containing protein n=1 Tax=Diploscapter pachys TaxID=2018661 RepID=A0A2A2KTT6_9BILA|nr:hypothetical protein WR25_17908 [Diploscapter pachys]